MRSENEMKNLIINFAKKDVRIRAVLLNGSRANFNIKPDWLQDFDLVFIVDHLESFTSDHSWINIFGEKIIFQLPDAMILDNRDVANEKAGFTYLILFKDGNRVDLTLFPKQKLISGFKPDSLTILWLDKDNLFSNLPESSDADYYLQKPTEELYRDNCNEFWWVSTNVGKGLFRKQIIYSKKILETSLRPVFIKIIEWKIGLENDFKVSTGNAGRYFKKFLPEEFYQRLLLTYANFEIEENWKALFIMTEIFQATSDFIGEELGFPVNKVEQQNTLAYLTNLHELQNQPGL